MEPRLEIAPRGTPGDGARRRGGGAEALTPFLLGAVSRATAGRSRAANLALLEENARVAGQIAAALAAPG